MYLLRLTSEDIAGDTNFHGHPIAPGLYHCGEDAWRRFAPRVIERLKKTPAVGDDGRPVIGEDGRPVMTLGPDVTLENCPHRMLQ